MQQLLDQLLALTAAKRRPPLMSWRPSKIGSIDIRIAANGDWFHEGSKIQRAGIVQVFASVLRREEDGFYLVTPAEKLLITVDDAPFVITAANVDGTGSKQRIVVSTNLDDHIELGPEHRLWMAARPQTHEIAPYCHIRARLNALVGRSVYYQLVECCQVHQGLQGVWSLGQFFPLE